MKHFFKVKDAFGDEGHFGGTWLKISKRRIKRLQGRKIFRKKKMIKRGKFDAICKICGRHFVKKETFFNHIMEAHRITYRYYGMYRRLPSQLNDYKMRKDL